MKEREVWDAVDAEGRKLGFDLYRDAWDTPRRPAGAYHEVVPITLQPGETVDSKFIPFEALLQAAHSEEYVLWCVESCEMQLRGYADAIR